MKINSPENIFKQMPGLSPKNKPCLDGRAFADALGRALNSEAAAQVPAAPASPGPVSISGVQFSSLPVSAPVNAVEKVDRLLELMEGYQQQLANPRQSLKSIAPQLDRVEKGMQELEKTIQKLNDADGLKSIAQEALVAATAEVFKFNRGDYNPA
ncbi:MAG: hypothetical protein ABIL58_28880 [Pseudomonadota bacterium]